MRVPIATPDEVAARSDVHAHAGMLLLTKADWSCPGRALNGRSSAAASASTPS
ncbi:hypothetical protein ACIBKY_26700 [Nonomuraea sp. NPDC050394]|uniref:hypothetical protein n=1 Tax=Nonomuraea sp. NPDC050394 TaxID=3364363 RepID=UPI0037A292DF